MDRFEAMSLFLDVIDHGGFSAAARARGLPVATVSRRIADLEASIGAQLLVRTSRVVKLTSSGEAYARSARSIVASTQAAERAAVEVHGAVGGNLVISAPDLVSQLYILPMTLDFMESHPEVAVTLRTTDQALDVIEEGIDVALRIGRLPDSSLLATRLGDVRLVAACAPSLLQRYGAPQHPQDLVALPQITFKSVDAATLRSVKFEPLEPIRNVYRDGFRVSVKNSSEAVAAAIQGAGVVLMTHLHVAHAVAAGELVLLLEHEAPPPLPTHLLHPPGPAPLKTRRFIDFAAPRLRRLLQSLPKVGEPPRPLALD